jgi:RND family efflux transporter MFP subunit
MNQSKYIKSLLTVALCISSAMADGPPSRTIPVVVDIAQLRELAPMAEFSGNVISENNARLSTEVEGRLQWIADVGDRVKKDDILVKLDDVFLQQEYKEELATIESEKAKFTLSDKQVKRFEKLLQQNNVSEDMLDIAISERAIARNSILAAQARASQINERIQRSSIRAPFDGVVTERLLQVGEWVKDGTNAVRLIDTEALEIVVRVPQKIYPLITHGQRLKIKNFNSSFYASVDTIVPVGTTTARLFELRLKPEVNLPPGTLIRAIIPTSAAREVVSIHRDALVIRRGSLSVFKITDENISQKVIIDVGVGDGDYIEVIGDIAANDRVVTRGGERLRPNEIVTIIE